jgi:hypothetical protein
MNKIGRLDMDREKIDNEIAEWAKSVNISNNIMDLELAFLNHLEEEEEYVDALLGRDPGGIIDSLCDKYIFAVTNNTKIGVTDIEKDILGKICDIQISHIEALGYNSIMALNEAIKHVKSRVQDVKQKSEWELNGPKGKFKKSMDPNDLNKWYKPDYDKCMKPNL